MNIYSVKNNKELCKSVKLYCMEKWNKVYKLFSENADLSVNADKLPQTWVIKGMEQEKEIIGFYQLIENDNLAHRTELSPFVSTLYVDERVRGYGFGELMLTHAKYEAAKLGYDKLYISTDHIGYYEKYGFREIGMDTYTWGNPTKIYEAYTPSEIRFEYFDRENPLPDWLYIEHAKFRFGSIDKNPAKILHHQKYLGLPVIWEAKWFSIAAFCDNKLAGWVNFMQNPDNSANWYIGDLSVAFDFRRKGIARKLISRGLDRIRSKMNGNEFVHSYIEKENTASILLHKSMGFIDLEECKPFGDLIFGENESTYYLKL